MGRWSKLGAYLQFSRVPRESPIQIRKNHELGISLTPLHFLKMILYDAHAIMQAAHILASSLNSFLK